MKQARNGKRAARPALNAVQIKIISLLNKAQKEIRRSYKFLEQFHPHFISLTEPEEKLKLLPPRSTC
jgi:hypothetical protein